MADLLLPCPTYPETGCSGVKCGQPLGLGVDLALDGAVELPERLDPDGAADELPRTGDVPSTRKLATDCGVFVLNTCGRCSSGRIPVRRAWTSSVASQVGRNRTGAGVSGSGRGARGRSTSSSPSSARNRRSSIRSSARHRRDRAPPSSRSRRGGRPEALQVAADDVGAAAASMGPGPGRSSPRRGRRGPRGGAPRFPTAGPSPGRARGIPLTPAEPFPTGPRAPGGASGRRRARARTLRAAAAISCRARIVVAKPSSRRRSRTAADQRHQSSGRRDGSSTRSSVPWTTDGRSSARVRDSRSNSSSPRPQSDVHRRRILRLDTPDPLQRLRQRVPGAAEQQLPGEQSAVQLSLGEGALGLGHSQASTETLR